VTIRVLLADDQALRAGAAGFLGKDADADQFLDGIRILAELTLR
jgi:DNA-binding NarL/FixJ family response regulator